MNTKEVTKLPNPGSSEACVADCKCRVCDNANGKGYMCVEGIFVYRKDCPVHTPEVRSEVPDSTEKEDANEPK